MQHEAVGEAAVVADRAVESVNQQPEVWAAAVLTVFVLVVFAVFLWRHFRKTPADRFVNALAASDAVSVLMHPNPDPDAMASAMAVEELASTVGTEATMQYAGQIRFPENRAFETVLDLDFDRIEHVSDLAASDVVLVDHNVPRGFEGADRVEPYAVVDHHPGNGEGTTFTDIRTDWGSCASLLTTYLRDRGWTPDRKTDGPTVTSPLATGLLYGIHADTRGFSRGCTPAEFEAAAYLFPAIDPDALDRIASPQLDTETLDIKARAIEKREIEGSFLISHVGEISNLDALPQAAEELVRLEGVTAAVVSGKRENELHLSGRSRDDRVHMGKALKTALEPLPKTSAGGHARMGGAQVNIPEPEDEFKPLPELLPDRDEDENEGEDDWIRLRTDSNAGYPELTERLFAVMSGEI